MKILKVGKSIFSMTIEKALSMASKGDTIKLAAGKYVLNTVINNGITFEAEFADKAVVFTGVLTINDTNCIFKNIEFECNIPDKNLITANQSNLMFEHCSFYGNHMELARAVFLNESNLTAYHSSFFNITSNAIKAVKSSTLMIYNSVFEDLKDSSAIYLEDSQLDIQDSVFINVATNGINAIGQSHIRARDCEWQGHGTQAPALYLNPTVSAEITSSIFKSINTVIFAQQATIILKSCVFMDIDDTHKGSAKQAQPPIINHLFKNMDYYSVIELQNSRLEMQGSRFINIAIHGIESIGQSHITARDCTWQMNDMPVLYLHPQGSAEITSSVFKGSNAIICVQQAALVLTSCEFIGISDNYAVRVKKTGRLSIIDCMFKAIANFPAVKVESSQLVIKNSRFIDIVSNGVNASGHSQIKARDCVWQVTQNPAVVLSPEVTAKISNSTFKGSHASIFTQQAKLILKSCAFMDITESNPVKITKSSQVKILDCSFNNIQDFYAVYAEANSRIQITDSYFKHTPFVAYSASQSKIEFIGELALDRSLYSEVDGGKVSFVNKSSAK